MPVPAVLHILPHPGGGGERVVEMLERIGDGYVHRRAVLSPHRRALPAAPQIALRAPSVAARARRSDLVHVVGDAAALLSLPLRPGRPAVFGTHGLHLLRRARGARRAAVRSGLRAVIARSSITVCSSLAERDELRALAPQSRDRLRIVRNAVETPAAQPGERQRVRAELGLAEDAIVALFLGELEERKDPETAVRAALAAAGRGLPVVLLVAGDGPLRRRLDQISGSPSVRVLGFRRDPERLLAAADLLTLPSRREGLPLSVLEALAAGLPVVASDEPGSREAVGDAGILVPPGDIDGFAAAFARLAADPAERARLGKAAASRSRERFGIDRFLDEMHRAFDEALGIAGATAAARAERPR